VQARTVECPFGAIDEDEKRFPVVNESRCRRCGTCMGACPVRVISFENYSINSVGAQIKAVTSRRIQEKPRILILACGTTPIRRSTARIAPSTPLRAEVIPVRCQAP
jgi:quinone-modifying oxidoreductase subunit QmoB